MGKVGCTQIPNSSCCISEKEKEESHRIFAKKEYHRVFAEKECHWIFAEKEYHRIFAEKNVTEVVLL